MTRETRHLRISNVPNDLTDSKLLDHFSNYGRVQKMERADPGSGSAVISFIDIRTAAKAMGSEHKVDGSELKASYYEPGSNGGSSGAVIEIFDSSEALNSASPRPNSTSGTRTAGAGSSTSKESPVRYSSRRRSRVDKERTHSSSSGHRRDVSRHSHTSSTKKGSYFFPRRPNYRLLHRGRGTFNRGRFPTRPYRGRGGANYVELRRPQSGYKDSFSGGTGVRRTHSNTASYPRQPASNVRQNSWDLGHQSRSRSSRQNGGSEKRRRPRSSSGSSGPSKSPSHRSSRSSASPSASVSSKESRNKLIGSGQSRPSAGSVAGKSFTIPDRTADLGRSETESPVNGEVDPSNRVGLVIRNLPLRSTDSSIKDGLFFTYKKLGKVLSVKVIGENADRYGIVTFRKGLDIGKTIEQTNNEMFFGSHIRVGVSPPELLDADDNEQKPLEKVIDEHHPRSSRTLYVGNLDPRVTENSLKDRFGQFGFIADVDIKNRDTPAPYAFVQYADITSVIKAIQETEHDNEQLPDSKRVKVGFGKTLPTNIVWLDEIPEQVEESYLLRKMKMYGEVTDVLIDHFLHQALITYQNDGASTEAVKQLKARTRTIGNVFVQVDYGSAQLNDLFIDRMYRSKQLMGKKEPAAPPPALTPRVPPPHPGVDQQPQQFADTPNGPVEQSFGRKSSKSTERRPYNRDYDFSAPFDGSSLNNGSHLSQSSRAGRDGARNPSKESSLRGSDPTDTTKELQRRHQNDPSPSSRRIPVGKKVSTSGQDSTRSSSGGRRPPRPRLPRRHSSGDSRRRRPVKGGERRRRRVARSPSSRSSSADESTSDSDESSSTEGSSSDSESSVDERQKQKGRPQKKPLPPPQPPPPQTKDDAKLLENRRTAILQMLNTLDESKQPPLLPPVPPPLVVQQAETPPGGVKPKLSDIFDLGWQKKEPGYVPTGVPPPMVEPRGTLQRQAAVISGPFEDEDLPLNQSTEDKEDSDSVGFKKRRPKQFQPRRSSMDETLEANNSPVEVNPHKPQNAQVGEATKRPTTPLTAPASASENRDSGFFDGDTEQTKQQDGVGMKDKKQLSVDSAGLRRDSWAKSHHSPISASFSGSGSSLSAHGNRHHGTQMIPLEQKPPVQGLRDPRKAETKPQTKCDLPLPKFAESAVFVVLNKSSDSAPAPVHAETPKSSVRRTVSGESSSEDQAGHMTSPEGSLPTPTGDVFGGAHTKSPAASFSNSGGSPGSRPSLEERIRALDAKFSALEQNMQAAKDKPSQNPRAVDISKYVVKKKPQNSAPIASSSTESAGEYSSKSLYKSSIFEQDIERLKGLEEKYTPSAAALLSRSAEVKSEPLEDILENLGSKESIKLTTTVGGKVKVEKQKNKASVQSKQGKDVKTPLSIHIPPTGQQQPIVDTSKPPPPLPHTASAIPGPGLSPSMLISPPPQRGILKKPKTPTSAAPNLVPSSGPVFPPNLSVPPPPLPSGFPPPPQAPASNVPVTPTDPRMAAKKDSTVRSPTAETPPTSAPPLGVRANLTFPGAGGPGGFQKSPTVWGQNRTGPPPGPARQQSFPMEQKPPAVGTVLTGSQPGTPKSAYNIDPRKQGFFPSAPKREEKQFGLKHDRPPEAKEPTIFQIMGFQGSNRPKQSAQKPNKELRNKELEDLFRKQGQENKISEQRKELPKIKKKELPPQKEPERKASSETSGGEKKKLVSENKLGKERDKELLKQERIRKERKEQERREAEKNKSLKQKPGHKKEERTKKKKRSRLFSSTQSSSDESEDSDSGSDDSDVDKKSQKSFEKELQKILEEEAQTGGQSMYDRVKRRSSAARGDQKYDFIEKQKEYLDKLKKQREKQKAAQVGGKHRRVKVSSSSEDEGENEEKDSEEHEEEPPAKKPKKAKEEKTKKSKEINIRDVFGLGESSEELEESSGKKEKKKKKQKEESESDEGDQKEEASPPPKKAKVQKETEKEPVKEKKKRGRKPKNQLQDGKKAEKTEKGSEKKRLKKKSGDTSGQEDSGEQAEAAKKERKEARRKEKEEKKRKKLKKQEKAREAESESAMKNKPQEGSTPPLMTKAALKAAPSPVKSVPKEEKTLDTNEDVPSDIVEALKRSSNESGEQDTEGESVVLQEYAEEVQLEGVEPGDQVLVVGENGQVEEFEVQAEETEEKEEERKESSSGEEGEKETETETEKETEEMPEEPSVIKNEPTEETETAENVVPPPETVPQLPALVESEPPLAPSAESEMLPQSEDVKEHELLSEQRSDPSSHVDEVIDDVVHGYVEIDPEKLIKITAKQAQMQQQQQHVMKQSPPMEHQDIWETVQAQLQKQAQQTAPAPNPAPAPALTPATTAAEATPAAVQQVVDASHAQALLQQRAAAVSQAPVPPQPAATLPAPPVTASYEQLLLQQMAAAVQSSGISPQLPVSTPSYAAPGFPNPSALYPGPTAGTPYQMPLDPQSRMLLELQAQQKQAWGGLLPGPAAANRLPQATMEQHLQRLQQIQDQQRQQQQWMATYQQPQVSQASGAAALTPQTPTVPQVPPVSQENTTPPGGGGEKILQRFPVKWQGYLALKTDQVLVQMHYVSGNPSLISSSLPPSSGDQATSTLRISQRMRLEQQQLDGVQKRMLMPTEHCVLLALPCGHSAEDIIHYSKVLHEGFINYLSQKQAAGIVNVIVENQCTFVVHIFPPCDFAQRHLLTAAPDFLRSIQERNTSFLFVVITTVN